MKKFTLIAIGMIQFIVLASFLPNAAGTMNFDFNPFAIVELLIAVCLYSAITGKWVPASITIALLLVGNFFLTPYTSQFTVKLPKNLLQQFEISGTLFPGLSGLSTLTTDSEGYRTLDHVDYKNRGDIYRIVAIGGSTTQQLYIDDEKTWTNRLSQLLNKESNQKVEVINAGFSGPRAENHFYALQSVKHLKPNLVIFLLGINDWNHDIRRTFLDQESITKKILNSLLSHARFAYHYRFEHSPIGLTKRRLFNYQSHLDYKHGEIIKVDGVEFAKNNYNSLNRSIQKQINPVKVSDDYKYWLGQIIHECKKMGVVCLFANQPTAYSENISEQLKKNLWMTPPGEQYTLSLQNIIEISSAYNHFLLETAANEGFESCDLAQRIKPTVDNFYDDCHYNNGGATRVANELNLCVSRFIFKKK